jgi:hypothetical protein
MVMPVRRAGRSALPFALLLLAAPGFAALPDKPPDAKQDAKEDAKAEKVAVDPDAVAALKSMGTYLRTLKAFEVEATTTKEAVLDSGEKVQFGGVTHAIAQPPNRLRVDVDSDRQEREYIYDGKSFTLWAQRPNYYATVPAPATIGKLADELEEKYGIEMPLVDLFRWGAPGRKTEPITAARDIGPAEVDGTTCEHYAFRQEGLDWQVWIQLGEYPLPRKLVLTDLTDDARPQTTAVYAWNLAPSMNEASFTFDPPSDARKIVFAEPPPSTGSK